MSVRSRLLWAMPAALAGGAGLALLSPGSFGQGWASASALLAVAFFSLLSAWNAAGRQRLLRAAMALAFLLRIGVGTAYTLALPVYGYDEPEQRAGYMFYDAYQRDTQAWELAESQRPLGLSFRQEFATDQYGGLLGVSALVYRLLSPEAHRPLLILILAAFVFTLGLPFFWQAVQQRWGFTLAALAGWGMVLYPDSVFFTSSQMREPFLIGLSCIALWAILTWQAALPAAETGGRTLAPQSWSRPAALGLALLGLFLFSSRAAAAIAAVLAVWFLLERLQPLLPRARWLSWAVLALCAVALFLFSWEWLRASSQWDMLVTQRASGMLKNVLGQLPERLHMPFVIAYGLTQPVLPAALADTALPLWKWTAVVRAAGWYLLAPVLAYALYASGRARKDRRLWLWLAFAAAFWLLVSSARAGGDATDNPRYRMIFLPLLALLAAYGLQYARTARDGWLARILAVEAIFLGFFTHWYIGRTLGLWKKLPFLEMTAWIILLSVLVLASGWLWAGLQRLRQAR